MPVRTCHVSFTDTEGIRHTVQVLAESLYEAAALALAEVRRADFTDGVPGSASRLTVAVKAPETEYEIPVSKVEAWLHGGGKSPNEQVLKNRLRGILSR